MFEPELQELIPSIFESLQNLIVTDKDDIVIYFSKSYSKLLCAPQEEVLGHHVTEVIPNTRMHIVRESGVAEIGSPMPSLNRSTGEMLEVVCNRIPIRRGGEPDGEILGVVAEGIIDFQGVNRLYLDIAKLEEENAAYRTQIASLYRASRSLDNIKGSSPAIADLKSLIEKVSNSNITVYISGETGTGKELVANAIHRLSPRADGPFIKINCVAIPQDLLESELFGYESGAFTGASRHGKIGKFELANHGTLLLDEIGEMPLVLQSKLLRVLQEKEIERVGGTKPIPLDVRLICSTNCNLHQLVAEGKFREDLYYRINVMELPVPPLRERFEDLPELCAHFIHRFNRDSGLHITGVRDDVFPFFAQYHWPGNIRELEHAIERACVLLASGELKVEHFNFLLPRIASSAQSRPAVSCLQLLKDQTEREEIVKALATAGGNKSIAARLLQIDRSVLYAKLKKHDIPLR